MYRGLLAAIIASSVLTSCSDMDQVESAAEDFCRCLEPVLAVSRQAMSEPDTLAASEFAQSMNEQLAQTKVCFDSMKNKYQEHNDDADFKSRVQQRIVQLCPGPMSAQ